MASDDVFRPELARSVAHNPLPTIPENNPEDSITLVLFYQYLEPLWTKKEHRGAMAAITDLGNKHGIKGRGRCAPEGLNCTLSGTAQAVRDFCLGLRAWNKIFEETDFKLTDGLPRANGFKSFGLRKVDELVGYGLSGEKAPELSSKTSVHLEADEYHAMLSDTSTADGVETVIVDVRNTYESAIGHFAPPPGGAKLIDPKMRNSHDFPGWLNKPEVQQELNGKRVMMYCTGGIRCERASALLGEVAAATPGFKPAGVFELRGGIERYLKTYPKGGAWAGKNYLFDRRMAQVPETKGADALAQDLSEGKVRGASCAGCRIPWDTYRGKATCAGRSVYHGNGSGACGVPIILCPQCESASASGSSNGQELLCELCAEGYAAPSEKPDFAKLRKTAEELKQKRAREEEEEDEKKQQAAADQGDGSGDEKSKKKKAKKEKKEKDKLKGSTEGACTGEKGGGAARVFVGRLPLSVEASAIKALLTHAAENRGAGGAPSSLSAAAAVEAVEFLTDKESGAFYGSCFVQMATPELANRAAEFFAAQQQQGQPKGKPGQQQQQQQGKKNGKGAAGNSPNGFEGLLNSGGKRKLKVNVAPPKEGEVWPPAGGFSHKDRPPIPASM